MFDFDVKKVSGVGECEMADEAEQGELVRRIYKVEDRAFLVLNKNTLEVRCDAKLSKLLVEQYESVMQSRYFGKGGIEIVDAGQLSGEEIDDLVRLSYNLTAEK